MVFLRDNLEGKKRAEERKQQILENLKTMSKEEKTDFFKTDEYQEFLRTFYRISPSPDGRKKDADMQLIKAWSNKYYYNKGFIDGINNAIKVVSKTFNHSEEELKQLFDELNK